MKKIIVTGANGQLGQELKELREQFGSYQFYFFEKQELDISDAEQVNQLFSSIQPHYCINCAAYTAVDKAETDKEASFSINATAVHHLAAACTQQQTKFIHISTDYVFDGTAQEPYKEEDQTNPLSVYGASKLKGEELCVQANKESIIIRTSWVYSAYGNNFVKTMLRLMQSKPGLNVVADQYGHPTYAADLAAVILHIIQAPEWLPGIYHFSNEGMITWFQFAQEIAGSIHSSCVIHPITTEQYPTAATRPKFSVLNKEKIQRTYNVQLAPWKNSLHTCLSKLKEMHYTQA